MKRSIHYNLMIIFMIMLLFVGCSNTNNTVPNDMPEEDNTVQENLDEEGEVGSGVFEGDTIKDFYIEDNSGNGIRLSELVGKVIVLNFWTSWSMESESVNTILSECSDTFNDSIHIVSVNVTAVEGHNLEYVIKYIRSKGYLFPIYFDLEGEVAKQYLVRSFPTTYIIDADGTVKNIYIGEINKEEFLNEIRNLIDE